MITRWIYLVSLALALSAFCIQWASIDGYLDARKQQTQNFLHHLETPDFSADALLHKSRMLSYCAVPIAATSAFCLFLSCRRKEPIALAWRCGVTIVLAYYFYGLIGPI